MLRCEWQPCRIGFGALLWQKCLSVVKVALHVVQRSNSTTGTVKGMRGYL